MAVKKRPSKLSPFAMARRNFIYKGVLGGERKWLYVGGAVWGVRSLRKSLGKSEEIVTLEKMEPGQWMSLRTIPPTTRRQRKAAEQNRKIAVRTSKITVKNDKLAAKIEKAARKAAKNNGTA